MRTSGPSDDAGRPDGSGPEGDPAPADRDDPFGCARLRARALAAWTASPDRLREDANAEEELALGGYRDRVVVELAQNAADAAVRGGEAGRGRLLLRLSSAEGAPVLLAASGGVPLDAAGVRALAGLRASTKRPEPGAGDSPPLDGVVGRFGVGFTAVLGVSDAPALLTAAGGVGFDRRRAVAAAHEAAAAAGGELAAEVARRGGSLPVLRTPFAVGPDDLPRGEEAAALVEDGWSTVVVLPLRPDAVEAVGALLDAVDDLLLLALPALGEVRVERPGAAARVLRDVADRWVVLRRNGTHEPAVLAGRPAEERADPRWALAWALPRRPAAPSDPLAAALGRLDGGGADPSGGAGVVLAPTPTDEPLPWPAVLVAGLPLEPTRRHVEPGPAADAVLVEAGAAYADLLALVAAERADAVGGRAGEGDDAEDPPGSAEDPADRPGRADEPSAPPELPDPLDLVPVGPSAGWVDAALRRALERVLPDVPLLAPAAGGTRLLPGARALALEDGGVEPDAAALAALAVAEPALVASPRRHREALTALGVGRLPLADLVDAWPLPAPGEDLWETDETGLAEPAAEDGRGGGLLGWRAVAGALAPLALDQRAREALSALPVPLVGGRWARGCRGALLAGPAVDALAGPEPAGRAVGALLVAHGLRLVDPRAVEDRAAAALLERLGAAPAGAGALLDDPATGSAVLAVADALAEDDLDALVLGLGAGEEHDGDGGGPGDADPDDVVDALADVVLGWLADDLPDDGHGDGRSDGGAGPWPVSVVAGARAWLLDLPLRDDGDELAPAASLVLPGSPAEAALDPEEVAPVADDLLDRWSAAVLVAAGVTASAGLLVWDDVDLDDPPAALADAAPEWLDGVLDALDGAGGWVADEVALVRDLDLVVGAADGPVDVPVDAADGVVALLAAALGDPRAGGRLHPRLRLRGPAGEALEVPSPTAVAVGAALSGGRPATTDGGAPGPTAAPDADPALTALLPPASGAARALPPAWGAAAGVARSWADLGDLRAWAAVLDPAGAPALVDLLAAWAALAHRVGDGLPLDGTPDDVEQLLAVDGGRLVRRPAEDVVVVDDPLRATHPACGPALLVPRGAAAAVADALGLGLATEELPGRVDGDGRGVLLPDDVRALLRLAGGPGAERVRLVLHDRLVVDGEAVDAWLEDADGAVTAHAVDARGAGRAVALAAGAWGARSALAEALLAAGVPAPVGSPEPWALLVDVALDRPGA
ncbi:hypothetical protein WDV85_03110 [Pseudokineococcus sp. 5B2Z-1]|uniref:sacsin N-terminal ATP-binding-like domain-containing protein n=1 Tax=Pseudokineococcus sp. 5B2Z-1 TaxID=3132744 RepID=UPI0030A24A0A